MLQECILSGSGMGDNGTLIHADGLDRIGVIRILGKTNRTEETAVAITDQYVSVNAMKFTVADATNLKVGDYILIHRPSTKNWIETLKTAEFGGGESALGWKPDTRDILLG